MADRAALLLLLTWTSPSFPIGAFGYSQGLEWCVEAGDVRDEAGLAGFALALIGRGQGWVDAVLLAAAWRAATADPAPDDAALDDIADLAAAWRGGAEAALESRQQGGAFLATVRAAAPHPALDGFAARRGGSPTALCTAFALACAAHGIALADALTAYLHGIAANAVSAGIRLGVTGQTGGQRTLAAVAPAILRIAGAAAAADVAAIGSSAVRLELAGLAHETQHTRLFRS